MIKVLFVCMGNICRSPTAEGVFRELLRPHSLAQRIHIDSAGTHAYHIGNPPDSRAQAAAAKRGIDLSGQRARCIEHNDFESFDYILAMDQDNLTILQQRCPPEYAHKLTLFLEYAPELEFLEVPDPYYGGSRGFDRVLDMIEAASIGLLAKIQRQLDH